MNKHRLFLRFFQKKENQLMILEKIKILLWCFIMQ